MNLDYNKLITIAKKVIINYNNLIKDVVLIDVTLEPEDLISNAYIKMAEEGIEHNYENFSIYIRKSISVERNNFSKVNPHILEKIINRAKIWNITNKDRYSKNQRKYYLKRKSLGLVRQTKIPKNKNIEYVNTFKENNPDKWKEIQSKSQQKKKEKLKDSYVRGIIRNERKKNNVTDMYVSEQEIIERRNIIINRRKQKCSREIQ